MTVWTSRRPDGETSAELAESRSGTGSLAGLRLAVGSDVDVAGMSTATDRTDTGHTPFADAAVVSALRAAGAVVLGTTSAGSSAGSVAAVATGGADIAIAVGAQDSDPAPAAAQGIIGITPTPGVVSSAGIAQVHEFAPIVTIFASTLPLADLAMGVVASGASSRHWPTDVRLAAPPTPVVAIADPLSELDRPSAAAFDAAVEKLAADGCRVVTVDIGAFREISTRPALARADDRRLRERAMATLVGADALLVPTAVGFGFASVLDMCAVTVEDVRCGMTVLARAFDDAVAVDIAALLGDSAPAETVWPLAVAEHAELVVFGAHLRGGPLVHQLTDRGARFAGEITTAPRYRMTALPTTPAKPGVTRVPDGVDGAALTGHRWLLSPAALGRFLAELPAPMQLGKVEFADGSWRTAFGCDGSTQGVDVSRYGSWTNALAAGAVRHT